MKLNLNDEAASYLERCIDELNRNIDRSNAYNAIMSADLSFGEAPRKALASFIKRNISPSDDLANDLLNGNFSSIKSSIIEEQHYIKVFPIKAISNSDIWLGYDEIRRHSFFLFDEIYGDSEDAYKEITKISYFEKDVFFPSIKKDGVPWMSIVPHEIQTMKPSIAQCVGGKVLVLGLGLGYFPYCVAAKEKIERVDVVELDETVVSSIEQIGVLKSSGKINIIEGDAIHFYDDHQCEYDTVFADIWHNEDDGLPLYLLLKSKEKRPTMYWIERSILCKLRRYLLVYLTEVLSDCSEDDYQKTGDFVDNLFFAFSVAFAQKTLKTEDDIKEFLSDDALKAVSKTLGKLIF